MIWALRILFSVILVAMLWVTTWASMHSPIWNIPEDVFSHPWFVACLFDAYFGFLTFFVWVAYKENRHSSRLAWLVAVLLLGNIAMSVYMLILLCRTPASTPIRKLLLNPREVIA
jgi:hypothetical protein